ncbi:DUF262 domain-containing protein [Kitasatospora purpeofusca]|uniref:DUF262 domain-containing protein n=1 Tax=Kitasatospora purpeofusca TaxID=67352 RepID=UPI0035D9E730
MTQQTDAPLRHTTLNTSYRTAKQMARLAAEGDLDLNPPYQRGGVWTTDQRIALVKSWLTGIPAGTVIISDRGNAARAKANGRSVYDTGEPTWACIDGKQRITTARFWFDDQFAVPASWFPAEYVATTEETGDGPYVRFSGLTRPGRLQFERMATLQVAEAQTAETVQDEAAIYLLVNGGGTAQTDDDLAQALAVSRAD